MYYQLGYDVLYFLSRLMELFSCIFIYLKAEDQGKNKLQGFCNFEVTIGDINDNVPRFSSISESIPVFRDHDKASPIWTSLRAEDADAGENATVQYFLVKSNATGVTVRKSDGFIYLERNDLDVVSKL